MRAGNSRWLFDAVYLLLLTLTAGPAALLVGVLWSELSTHTSSPARFLAVPALGFTFVTAVLLCGWALRLLVGRLEPGEGDFPKSALARRWSLHFALGRALAFGAWRELIFSTSSLRWLFVRAMGGRAAFDMNTAASISLPDACLLDLGPGCMVAATCILGGHIVESGKIRVGRIRIGENAQLHSDVRVGPGVSIGEDSIVGPDSRIAGNFEMGARSQLGHRCTVAPGVRVGDDVVVGHQVVLDQGVVLEAGASVPSGVTVPKGTRVPEGTRFRSSP